MDHEGDRRLHVLILHPMEVVLGLVNGLVAAKLLAELPPPAAGPASANRAGQSPAEADSPER